MGHSGNNFAGRNFQLWEFKVSHGQLLIRSAKSALHSTNIDFIFRGVSYVCLPRYLDGMTLAEPTSEDLVLVSQITSKEADKESLFVLVSKCQRHFVVAEKLRVEENEVDIFDSSLLDFNI